MSEPAVPSAAAMAAWRAFLAAHAGLTERLEHELQAGKGMPLTWYDVLVQLAEAPDHRLRMHELANRVLLSRAGLTRLVDRMASAGLVRREPCTDDRRGTFVTLTPEGKRANLESAPCHLAGIQEHFAKHLDEAEMATIEAAFNRILAALARDCPGDQA
jgi:DNA-binding MarR family transcriptional regulator